mmetsp:Transcript_86859/g.278663  ORF Transcript_86859/g.278663 Transcript_86859/m.278663 type:complete len:226 (-) Transcript_86859:218-895(-)
MCYSCLLHVAADECGDLNSPASMACSTAADLQLLQRKQRRSPKKFQPDSSVAEEFADPHVESRALEGRAEAQSNTAIPDREAAADSTPLPGRVTVPRWDATAWNSDNSVDQQHPMREENSRSATYCAGLALTVLCIPALVLAVYGHYLDKQGRIQQHVLQMQQQRLQEKQELQQQEEELIHRHQDEQEYRLMLQPQPFPSADDDAVPPPPAPHPVPRPSSRPLPY